MAASDLSSSQDVTIANAASLSGAANVAGYRVAAIVMPAAWTAADLTFQGSRDASAFANIYDGDGIELKLVAAVSRMITPTSVQSLALLSWRQIKVRSGTSGTPVNQGAARTLTVVLVPA